MDKVLFSLDTPMSHIVNQIEQITINIRTTGYKEFSFAYVLSVAVSSEKCPPMIIFKKEILPKEKFIISLSGN